MLCLKKVYTDELLQIAILLSLLRVDRNSNLTYDVPVIGVGINDDIHGREQSPHTLIHRDIRVHPKNLDSILLNNYEQHVFDELNSLGRYNRINLLRHDVTAYLLNVDDLSSTSSNVADSPAGSSFTTNQTDENINSGNEADSEGSSEPEPDSVDPVPDVKQLCNDDELTQEDMDLIEVLWKQDVDLGLVTTTSFDSLTQDENFACLKSPPASSVSDEKLKKPYDATDQSPTRSVVKEEEEIDPWAGLAYTIDLETGEYILKDEPIGNDVPIEEEPPSASLIDQSDFSLAEALELVGLDEDTFELPDTEESEKLLLENESEKRTDSENRQTDSEPADSGGKDKEEEEETTKEKDIDETNTGIGSPSSREEDLEVFDDLLLTEMIQTPQFHPRSFQGRMPYVRTMSMEQRWQDLANLLSLPDPNHPYHHLHPHPGSPYPGSPYPGGSPGSYHGHSHSGAETASTRNVLLHNATLAPPIGDLNSTSTPYSSLSHSNLGSAVATSMNLTNSSEPMGSDPPGASFKMENQDMMYYQNGSSEMNHTTEGFLSSILNDEDLQLMDMAMNEGMYTMRMLDGGAACAERGADSDSAVSSMGSERVPSLSSDTEWMETNSDSGHTPADHYTDYHSNKYRWYDYSYSNRQHSGEGPVSNGNSRIHPVAQKKHHLYGKRFFQEQGTGVPPSSLIPHSTSHPTMSNVKFEFPGTDGNQASGGGIVSTNSFATASPLDISKPQQSEMKYSCSLEFSRQNLAVRTPLEHVAHNHTYHLPPEQAGAMQRPITRDKQKGKRSEEEHMTRDEKRARALNVPLPVNDIINLPMDEFNERLSKYDLSESQLSLIRDIRRRGKNKVAAQNCRKRKLDQIMSLADEVKQMRERKQRLVREHDFLIAERQRVKNKLSQLYRHIFQALRDPDGNPYSPYDWSLQQAADGSVILVPRSNSSSMLEQTEPRPSKHSKEPDPDHRKQ
ncbi:NFE2 like bZIP transcription factor cap-n-collar isoform X2 [Lycorma delicatula]|uniref:NFE2 like bZIP transcription factor cap-n-collar isoform X2 n=1 Tax=Lycorma delicatula TaxID=130591 RepID=UPI003F5159FD